ncbi:MAG: hypothetical protein EAZ26_13460, partial [Runella slithyformis]
LQDTDLTNTFEMLNRKSTKKRTAIMKKIALIAALCFVSFEGMSIGRPHNVFAMHQMAGTRVATPVAKKIQDKPVTQVIDDAKAAAGTTKQAVSVVRLLVRVFGGF